MKFLQSNPVQILLCVIVLLDAGIVIAQILLDLNSVKGRPATATGYSVSHAFHCVHSKVSDAVFVIFRHILAEV